MGKKEMIFVGKLLIAIIALLIVGYLFYIQAQAAAAFTFDTGSYTGNGTSQYISSLEFEPDLVIIKAQTGGVGREAIWRTSDMPADFAITMSGLGDGGWTDAITSLDTSGFSVGADTSANASGVTYYWTAWGDSGASNFKVGTYIGNGVDNRSIAGIGFQPDIVWAQEADDRVSWTTSSFIVGESEAWDDGYTKNYTILGLESDGFEISDHEDINITDATFYYVAFKSTAGSVAAGYYEGDDVDGRSIAVGFEPRFVLVKRENYAPNPATIRNDQSVGDSSTPVDTNNPKADIIQALEVNGFEVGNKAYYANWTGFDYQWMAFAEPVIVTPLITILDPESGNVGASVTITGTDFGASQGSSTVIFNGTAVSDYTSWSDTEVVVDIPTDATTGNVVITVGGEASAGTAFTVTVAAVGGRKSIRPEIISVIPTQSASGEFLALAVKGNKFEDSAYVSLFNDKFGWIDLTTQSLTETKIIATLSTNNILQIGVYDVVVTNPGGSQSVPEFTLTITDSDEDTVEEDAIDEEEEDGEADQDATQDEEDIDNISETESALVGSLRGEIDSLNQNVNYLEQGINYFANFFRSIFAGSDSQLILQNSYSYEVENTEINVTVAPEELIYVTIPIKNTGIATWYQRNLYPINLGTSNPLNRKSIFATNEWSVAHNRVPMPQETIVALNEVATFLVPIQAPTARGFYPEEFKLVSENLLWISGPEIKLNITVE